jgi:hypothetical protein
MYNQVTNFRVFWPLPAVVSAIVLTKSLLAV